VNITKEKLNNTVLTLSTITIVAAFLGYALEVKVGVIEAFYSVYGFFGGNGGVDDIGVSILLKIASFTAPLSIALLVIFLFFQQLNKWFFLTFRAKDHFVICGLGHMGMVLAEDILENHRKTYRKLVIIERDEANPNIDVMRLRGAIVLHEDSTSLKVLEKVKANQAKCLVALTGNDVSNLEIAIGLAKIDAISLKIYLHLENRENESLLRNNLFKKLDIKSFNSYDNAAQTLFMRHPIGGSSRSPISDEVVRVAVFGVDSVGASILYRLLNLGHFYNGLPIEVVLYDEQVDSRRQQFLKTFPIDLASNYWNVSFESEESFYTNRRSRFDQIIFCKTDTQSSFADAMRLVRNEALALERTEVFVYADSHEEIASLVDAEESGALRNLFTFGTFRDLCSHDVIINEKLDIMGKITNARYNGLHGYSRGKTEEVQWRELEPFLKDANRMQVEHLLTKVNVLNAFLDMECEKKDYEYVKSQAYSRWFHYGGLMFWDDIDGAEKLASYIPLDVVENLAKMEKKRWNAFHILDGWKQLPVDDTTGDIVKKNKDQKLHPCLVTWEELDKVSENHRHDYKSDDIETVIRSYEMIDGISSHLASEHNAFKVFRSRVAKLD